MRLTNVRMINLGALALAIIPCAVCGAQTHEAKSKYPQMASVEQYLMPNRVEEIALARTAAPESISRDAEVLVLGRHGYETAVKGTNGLRCLVDRAWHAGVASTEVGILKIRGPPSFSPAAVRSLLPLVPARA